MSIIRYKEHNLSPEVAATLAEINEYSLRAKAMLTAMGDYWTHYYRNLDPIAIASTGSVAAISKEYTHLLDVIKSSNILDIPIQQSDQFELLVIDSADIQPVYDGGELDHYFLPLPDVIDTQYLTTSLFESRVVLVRGQHFDVVEKKGYKLYVDLFGDANITNYAYEVGEDSERHMLLWACDIAFSSSIIYERYGRFLYKRSIDSEKYKWVVSGLMRFYESAKTVQSIQDVLNIMYGIPYTRYANETITKIYYVDEFLKPITSVTAEEPFICVETDKASYYTYAFSDLVYKVGDVVPQFSLLADFNKVEDYVSNPGWWENCAFPSTLADGADDLTPGEKNELMDKVLKYNTVHLNLGVSIDSYATYLSQVKQVFEIIESGFPVYLYPLVDTFVRARFIDKVDMDEVFNLIRTVIGFTSRYDWGQPVVFDGTVPYSMIPDHDCGSGATFGYRRFDEKNKYCPLGRPDGVYSDVRQFDGQFPYETNFKYYPNNDREILTILKYGFRHIDRYVRNKKRFSRSIKYGDKVLPDGTYRFDPEYKKIRYEDDEIFSLSAKQKPLTDAFGWYGESLTSSFDFKFKEAANHLTFNGATLCDITLGQSNTIDNYCRISIKRSFSDTVESSDRFDIATRFAPMSDAMAVSEETPSHLSLAARFKDSFKDIRFNGIFFHNLPDLQSTDDESFTISVFHREI